MHFERQIAFQNALIYIIFFRKPEKKNPGFTSIFSRVGLP